MYASGSSPHEQVVPHVEDRRDDRPCQQSQL